VVEKIVNLFTLTLSRIPKAVLYLSAVMLVLALGIVDYFTGFEVSFAFFYLMPVAIAAWTIGRLAGFMLSLASAATWIIANYLAGEHFSNPLIPYWNAVTRLGFFLVVTVLLSSVRRLLEQERSMARTDFLTGALNRRAFYDGAALELARAGRYHHPFSLIYLDLDDFKTVNDRFGHGAGDSLLQAVGRIITRMIRTVDLAARLGGDEFAVLLPETDEEAARTIVGRLQQVLLQEVRSHGWPVTFSIGVLTCHTAPKGVEEMLHSADTVMYGVKSSGKNAVSYSVLADCEG
jgi:diguanylate cyclase (GGDEF)-like protein